MQELIKIKHVNFKFLKNQYEIRFSDINVFNSFDVIFKTSIRL